MQDYLFSYGTLQKETVHVELFKRILQATEETHKGYKVVTIEVRDKVSLAKGKGRYQQTALATANEADENKGTVFEITKEELAVTDSYEPDNYTRIKVKLQSGKEAWLYIAG